MTDETLYSMRVIDETRRDQLLTVTGNRDTVIEMALRVICDSAPRWSQAQTGFYVQIFKVTK